MYFAAGAIWKYVNVMNIKIFYEWYSFFTTFMFNTNMFILFVGVWNEILWKHIFDTLIQPYLLSYLYSVEIDVHRSVHISTYYLVFTLFVLNSYPRGSSKNHSYFSLDKQRTKEKGYNEMYCYGRLKVFLL